MDEITLFVTAEEYEKLSSLAEYYGTSLSDLIKKYSSSHWEEEYVKIKSTLEI